MAAPEKKSPRVKESQPRGKLDLERPDPQEVLSAIQTLQEFEEILPFRVESFDELKELLAIVTPNIRTVTIDLIFGDLKKVKGVENVKVGGDKKSGSCWLHINSDMNRNKPTNSLSVVIAESHIAIDWSSGPYRAASFDEAMASMRSFGQESTTQPYEKPLPPEQLHVTFPTFEDRSSTQSKSSFPAKFKDPETNAQFADLEGFVNQFSPERSPTHDQIEGYVDSLQFGVSNLLVFAEDLNKPHK